MPRLRSLSVLRKRNEFLAVASTRKKWVAPAFILQIGPRLLSPDAKAQVSETKGLGLTASKKMIGIAVARNRARRRLRALAADLIATHGAPGQNYVLIARRDVLTCSHETLRCDLETALRRLKVWIDA